MSRAWVQALQTGAGLAKWRAAWGAPHGDCFSRACFSLPSALLPLPLPRLPR